MVVLNRKATSLEAKKEVSHFSEDQSVYVPLCILKVTVSTLAFCKKMNKLLLATVIFF